MTALRYRTGLSQTAMCLRAGLHQSQLSLYERGMEPTIEHAERLLAVFQAHFHTKKIAQGLTVSDLNKPWAQTFPKLQQRSSEVQETKHESDTRLVA
jgi:transcriptional regulator with XRE-family HTH domain